ncbi:Protein fantom [Chionoecetes opilio]|uniref:Protein fantom n=1 Tax=Chionoecetes opilio TaxID=41210 RepID=A0A8J4XU26_CHIOP|nr:Protein fantom [Chionoecetes opilio]
MYASIYGNQKCYNIAERMTEKLLGVENQLRGVQEEQQKTAGKLLEVKEKNKVYEFSSDRELLLALLMSLPRENKRSTAALDGIAVCGERLKLSERFEKTSRRIWHRLRGEALAEWLTSWSVIFAESLEVLVMALEALHEEAKPLGLEVSWLKTKVQVFGGLLDEAVQSLHAGGEDIEILESFTYLGSTVQNDGGSRQEVLRRIGIAHGSDLSERGGFLEHMTQDKENVARAEEEVKKLKEKVTSLQEELQKANGKLNVYAKAGLLKLPDKDPTLLQPRLVTPSPKEFEKLREAHSELQLVYREKSRELEQLFVTLTSHSSTYQALQTQVMGLGKHDNVLEFHIDRVLFELPDFTRLKTFISWTVPFSLEDPLQHTNVARGTEAHYNYSALYKFQMNSSNLMSLKEDTVTVSVYILLDSGHPAKVGECSLTFQEVLDHPRNTLHGTVPVVLAHDDAEEAEHLALTAHVLPGQVIGSMSYWFRLQRPSEDAIAQYLHTSRKFSAALREKYVPKEFRVTKPTTTSMREKSVPHELKKKPESVQMSKEEEDFLECNEKPMESSIEHIPSESVLQSESDNHVHQNTVIDPGMHQMTRSRCIENSQKQKSKEIAFKELLNLIFFKKKHQA